MKPTRPIKQRAPLEKLLNGGLVAKKIFSTVKILIDNARQSVALRINSEMITVNWHIGRLINQYILKNKRATYGKLIISKLSQMLTEKYGTGYSHTHLTYCRIFESIFPDERIVHAMRDKLSWTQIRTILSIKDELKREFYLQMAIQERWTTRQLERRIGGMLYERTAISRRPESLIRDGLDAWKFEHSMSSDMVFRDPYILDFLNLKDTYTEADLETAIIAQMQAFLTELGTDFAFIARQKPIEIDNESFKIDLLFYHRGLKRLVAIDLKLDQFRAAHKGQMELYLKWLNKYEKKPGEKSPIGLILCTEKRAEQIELLELDKGHIRVAEYWTQLPSKKLLVEKMQIAINAARKS